LENLSLYIESLIFTSSKPLHINDINQTLTVHFDTTVREEELLEALDNLKEKYKDPMYSFEIIEIANGYQFMTKGAYYPVIGQYLKLESKKKLSRSALETLAIISYKQPMSKSQIEAIRGVNCDYAVQKLLDKELVVMVGRAEGPGRPLLYGTTEKFMDHFGLKNLKELPQIKEFEMEENSIGGDDLDLDSDDIEKFVINDEGQIEALNDEGGDAEVVAEENETEVSNEDFEDGEFEVVNENIETQVVNAEDQVENDEYLIVNHDDQTEVISEETEIVKTQEEE
jgi:segregation and condensation protein B